MSLGFPPMILLLRITEDVTRAVNGLKKVKAETQGLGSRIKSLVPSLRKAGAALSAFGAAGTFVTMKLVGAAGDLNALRIAFDNLREGSALSLEELQRAARGTVAEVDLIASANRAMMLGIDPTYLPRLMEAARVSAVAMGISTTQAFDDIVTGIGRQSKLILDNLGIIIDARKAYEDYAAQLGKAAGELTDMEKRQAFLNAAMAAAEERARRVGEVTGTYAETAQRLKAQIADLKAKLGEELLPVIKDLITTVSGVVRWFKELPAPVKRTAMMALLAATAFAAVAGPLLIMTSLIGPLVPLLGAFAAGISGVAIAENAGFVAHVAYAAGAKIAAAGQWLLNAAVYAFPGTWIVAAIAGVVAAVILLWKNWDRVTAAIGVATKWVKENVLEPVFGWLLGIVKRIVDAINWLKNAWDRTFGALGRAVGGAVDAVKSWGGSVRDARVEAERLAGTAYVMGGAMRGAARDVEGLGAAVGSLPSTGLVKSFEDLEAAIKRVHMPELPEAVEVGVKVGYELAELKIPDLEQTVRVAYEVAEVELPDLTQRVRVIYETVGAPRFPEVRVPVAYRPGPIPAVPAVSAPASRTPEGEGQVILHFDRGAIEIHEADMRTSMDREALAEDLIRRMGKKVVLLR